MASDLLETFELESRCLIKSSSRIFAKEYVEDGVPFFRSKDVIDKALGVFSGYDLFISRERYEELKKSHGSPSKGDLLISSVGNRSGQPYVVQDEGDFYFKDGNIIWISNFKDIDSNFLAYWFKSNIGQSRLASVMIGSAQKALTINSIRTLTVTFPIFANQKAIAHILGSLDDKIELNRQMNETLEAMAQALFKSWFVDFDPVIDNALAAGNAIPDEFSERAEQRKGIEKKDNSDIQDLFPEEFEFTEEMGWIPRGWQAVRFVDITEAKQGRYLASNQMTALPDDEHTYPVWGGNEVRGFSENFLFDSPVVVLTCRGSNCGLLKITEAESWVTNSSFACTPKFGSAYFLYIYFLNDDFSQSISGSAQPQITYTALKNNLMKFPISEKVVKNLSMRLEVLRSKQISCQKQSETLAKLRETLLPKLMSGELRILDAEALVEDI